MSEDTVKESIHKIFPLKAAMIGFTISSPGIYYVVLFTLVWMHYPSVPTLSDYISAGLAVGMPLVVGWMVYFSKRNKLMSK